MIQESIKVSLIDSPLTHQVLDLPNSVDNPLETPVSHLEDRSILTKTETGLQGKDLGLIFFNFF